MFQSHPFNPLLLGGIIFLEGREIIDTIRSIFELHGGRDFV